MDVNRKDGPLFYRAKGEGPLVVLLHGLLMDGHSWVSNGFVEALSQHFCVVSPDMLGHGMSDKPSETEPYEQQKQASIINAMIRQLGYEKAHIVGYSSGAWLATGVAKTSPELLSSLVIGGWDIENGFPDGPNGKLSFDAFLAYAKETAPGLTDLITSESALRAYFNTLRSYDSSNDSALLAQVNVPKMCWAGVDDIYYQPLNFWAEANHQPFISTQGNHVTAILEPEKFLIRQICEFILRAENVGY